MASDSIGSIFYAHDLKNKLTKYERPQTMKIYMKKIETALQSLNPNYVIVNKQRNLFEHTTAGHLQL